MKKQFLQIITAIVLIGIFAFSEENVLDKIVAGFKKYSEEFSDEKAYLHLDRSYYAAGETIWFKAYLTAGHNHEPSVISKTLYVSLLNDQDKIISQITLAVKDGIAEGNFDLIDSIPSGVYTVEAHTKWMKNFDKAYVFRRDIKIIDPMTPITKPATPYDSLEVQFFPEGGDWVNGVKSRIAFKAIGTDGLGKVIKGEIFDNDDVSITKIESNFLGMGSCIITPQKGKTYHARIGNLQNLKLPATKESGITLTVNHVNEKDAVVARIQSTEPKKTVLIVAQTRGFVCYAAKITIPHTISFVNIPRVTIPTGVTQLTVFDETGKPLCERLFFVNHDDGLNIKIESDKKTYKPRERVTVKIEATDTEGKPLKANLSLAVCDDKVISADNNQENIYSYLYLSSELVGNIESSGYYFDKKNADRQTQLDVLLMTQGWRKFLLADVLSGTLPSAVSLPETGVMISGTLKDKSNGKPIAGGKVSYLNTLTLTNLTATTKDNGTFSMSNLIYADPAGVLMKGETKRGSKNVSLVIDEMNEIMTADKKFQKPLTYINRFERNLIELRSEQMKLEREMDLSKNGILLRAVDVEGKREEIGDFGSTTYGKGSVHVRVADTPLENLLHPMQLIQGRVAGVAAYQDAMGQWTINIRGITSIASGTMPLILVDNVEVDISYLNMLQVRDIEGYDVFKGAETARFGSRGTNGAIAFFTKRGLGKSTPEEGLFHITKRGYAISRQFYSPNYEVQQPGPSLPDLRSTIHWAPNIATDSTGKASISFYNADNETSITGIIEGLSVGGKPGKAQMSYSVKKE